MALMKPAPGASILDVGGGSGDFLARIAQKIPIRGTVSELGRDDSEVRARGFDFVNLEEGTSLPFSDREYDFVVSISVIEHVTMPKHECMSAMPRQRWVTESCRSQHGFARELQRVGKAHFVQTPHKGFPLETHTWLPFVNCLNHGATVSLVRLTNKYWVKKCSCVDWNLLGVADMRSLFPRSSIYVERLVGLPKSIVAYRPA